MSDDSACDICGEPTDINDESGLCMDCDYPEKFVCPKCQKAHTKRHKRPTVPPVTTDENPWEGGNTDPRKDERDMALMASCEGHDWVYDAAASIESCRLCPKRRKVNGPPVREGQEIHELAIELRDVLKSVEGAGQMAYLQWRKCPSCHWDWKIDTNPPHADNCSVAIVLKKAEELL